VSAGRDTDRGAAKSLLIAGGGTGGHVIPALAVATEWMARSKDGAKNGPDGAGERRVVLVGTERGIETRLVPLAGFALELIRAAGLKGIGGAKFFRNASQVPLGLWDSERILGKYPVDVAFGVGGYASGPMMLVAAMHGIPTVVYEPNAEAGFANRLLFRFASRVVVGYEKLAARVGPKAVVTGCPIRSDFFAIPSKEHRPPFTIFTTGGSRGASPINQALIASLDLLSAKKEQLFVVHQTGERDYNAVREAYARHGFHAEVLPFIENMADRFAQADLVICRSGATTVAEVAAAGRVAIFIPFGASTDAHQARNAEVMQQAGAAALILQAELTPQRLTSEIFSLLDQPRRLLEMEDRARTFARPRAVEDIVDVLDGLAGVSRP
jgi:UDP-N-acetylglucosamine--N-acetylmuramyl-(pentapeptide) pyrophosphoryl-undecaprenol N-acetylglucosamine transferase